MTHITEATRTLQQRCQTLYQRQILLQKKQELEDQLPQAKHEKRESDVALAEYESGGFGVWLDRLRGKWEEKQQTLRRSASAAQSRLQSLQQEIARTNACLAQLPEQTDTPQNIRTEAEQLPSEQREGILHSLARISAVKLQFSLNRAKHALLEAQKWARPDIRLEAIPGYTKNQLLTEAESCARECEQLLLEIGDCEIPLDIHGYFQNPSGYIHAVASQFGELDRINSALDAIRRTEKLVEELLLQLSDADAF